MSNKKINAVQPPTTYKIAKQFYYEGRPFRICGGPEQRYRPFLALYNDNFYLPRSRILMTGRQCSKSTNLAATALAYCLYKPGLRILIANPLQEHAKNFSSDRLDAFISESPILQLAFSGDYHKNTFNRKIMQNRSYIAIEWVLNNPLRARSLTAHMLFIDEAQDHNYDDLPIIQSCLASSPHPIQQVSGTPYSELNTLAKLYNNSSAAEWVTPCPHCKYENIAGVDEDLLDMIGDVGPICADCGKPIDPDAPNCYFKHRNPELRKKSVGWHIPQIILPMHYSGNTGRAKWQDLLEKQKLWSETKFYNEVLGVPKTSGGMLITPSQIKQNCKLNLPNIQASKNYAKKKKHHPVIMGIDWSGGGLDESSTSKTAISVMGLKRSFEVDTLYYKDFDLSTSFDEQASVIDHVYKTLKPDIVYHDKLASNIHESTITKQTSITQDRLFGIITGVQPSRATFEKVKKKGRKIHFWMDKTRATLTFFEAIRRGYINFDGWERFEHCAEAYLAVRGEESTSKRSTGNQLLIVKQDALSDDLLFASVFSFVGIVRYAQAWGLFSNIDGDDDK